MSGDRAGDRGWLRVVPLAVLLATAFSVFAYQQRRVHVAAAGRPAPGFDLRDQRGQSWSLPVRRQVQGGSSRKGPGIPGSSVPRGGRRQTPDFLRKRGDERAWERRPPRGRAPG